jgi:hypothetical protein
MIHTRTPRSTRTLTTLAAAVVALALAGCSTDGDGGDPDVAATTPPATSSATPTPTATPDELPDEPDLDDPSTWLISFDGVGPLVIGSAASSSGTQLTPFPSPSGGGACLLSFYPETVPGQTDIWAIPAADGDTVVSVVVTGNSEPESMSPDAPHTAEGIFVGSTVDELLAAYPGIESSRDLSDYAVYALPGDGATWIDFSMSPDGEIVREIAVADAPLPPYEYCG